MKRELFRNVVIDEVPIEKVNVFYDDEGEVIVLPSLWLLQLSIKQEVWGWRMNGEFSRQGSSINRRRAKNVTKEFKPQTVVENTLDNYIGHVYKLLNYISKNPKLNVHRTENLTTRYLNYYLNDVLPEQLDSSESLRSHQSAISAYCNFLCAIGIWRIDQNRPTTINRKTRKYMADKRTRPRKISYIPRYEFNDLIRECSSQRDKLLLRMGYEVGLRTEENTGLELHDYRSHKGLLSLFDELDSKPHKMEWEYILRGKYTKGGKTGTIYFNRELLSAMREYYNSERKLHTEDLEEDCPTLFVRYDPEGMGKAISSEQGSNTFRSVKERLPHVNQILSYHDLRHSFATQLYHEELKNPSGQENRSESAALEVVRSRLRHKEGSKTVFRYIRLHQQMLSREQEKHQ